MKARFASNCSACHCSVEAGSKIVRHTSGNTFVHPECVSAPIVPQDRPNTWGEPDYVLLNSPARQGIFTVVMSSGSRRTIKVSDEQPDGTVFVFLLTGSDNENSYSCVGLIRGDKFRWTRKYANTESEPLRTAVATVLTFNTTLLSRLGQAYALESGKCYVCNRTLSTPESIEAGIGPVCAGSWAA